MTGMKKPLSLGAAVVLALILLAVSPNFRSIVQGVHDRYSADATKQTRSQTDTAGQKVGTSNIEIQKSVLLSAHTVGVEIDDMHLDDGKCHLVVRSAMNGIYLPDPKCTPGAVDPTVTQANLASTICRSGYTRTVRPSASITGRFKAASLRQYGLDYSNTTEYDHLVSLELGGASTVSNLWPEPNRASGTGTTNPKDAVESKLNEAVCSEMAPLAQAQAAIARDWTTAITQVGLTVANGKLCLATNHSRCAAGRHSNGG
jgi:hypothetical protein